jgi:carbamoylphosphate synthase large subunit
MAFEILKSETVKTITVLTILQITDPELQRELGSIVHIIDTINAETGSPIESVYRNKDGYELNYDTCESWAIEKLWDFVEDI